jgi:hypothetical protein
MKRQHLTITVHDARTGHEMHHEFSNHSEYLAKMREIAAIERYGEAEMSEETHTTVTLYHPNITPSLFD